MGRVKPPAEGCCFHGPCQLFLNWRRAEEEAVLRHVVAEVRQTLGRLPPACDEIVELIEGIKADVEKHNKKTNSTRVGFAGVGITGGSCILAAPLTGGVSVLAGGILCSAMASFGSVGTLANDHYRSKYDFAPRLRHCDKKLGDLATELDLRLGALVEQLQMEKPGIDLDTAHEVLRDLVQVMQSGFDAAQGLVSVVMMGTGTARTMAMTSATGTGVQANGAAAAEAASAKTTAASGAATAAQAHGAGAAGAGSGAAGAGSAAKLHSVAPAAAHTGLRASGSGAAHAAGALRHLHTGSAAAGASQGLPLHSVSAAAAGLSASSPTASQIHAAGSAVGGAVSGATGAGTAAAGAAGTAASATSTAAATGAGSVASAAATATRAVGIAGGVFGILAGVLDGGIAMYSLKHGHPSEKVAGEYLQRVEIVKEKCAAIGETIASLP